MKDRRGFEYEELLAIQNDHLALWGTKCRDEVIDGVAAYVRASNRCATQPDETHTVYRGHDLIEIIRQWPDVSPPFPPNVSTEDVL